MKITIIVGGRFHAFNLAQQLQKRNYLEQLVTSYPKIYIKNKFSINEKKDDEFKIERFPNIKVFKDMQINYDNFFEISDSKPSIELITMFNDATPNERLIMVTRFVRRKTKLLFFEINNFLIKNNTSFI